jgi:hypothetical protein
MMEGVEMPYRNSPVSAFGRWSSLWQLGWSLWSGRRTLCWSVSLFAQMSSQLDPLNLLPWTDKVMR